jgi:hypothetical protein
MGATKYDVYAQSARLLSMDLDLLAGAGSVVVRFARS